MTRTAKAILDSSSPDTRRANPHLFWKAEPVTPDATPQVKQSRKEPNQTEADYRRKYIDRRDDVEACVFQGIQIKLRGGNRYTTDWVVYTTSGQIEVHECKGVGKNGYHHPSYNRAQVAFNEAAVLARSIKFVWAERRGGVWTVKQSTLPGLSITVSGRYSKGNTKERLI